MLNPSNRLHAGALLAAAALLAGCASTQLRPDEGGAVATLAEALPRLKLQLRRGPGAYPCKSLGAGLEACPVIDGPTGLTYVGAEHLSVWERERRAGPPIGEEAFAIGYLALIATSDELSVKWFGDEKNPKLLGVITRGDGDAFDAARILVLPSKVEHLVDELGLQFLAAVPNQRTLIVLRDEDPRARALAEHVMADQGVAVADVPLAPGTFFQVTPDGVLERR